MRKTLALAACAMLIFMLAAPGSLASEASPVGGMMAIGAPLRSASTVQISVSRDDVSVAVAAPTTTAAPSTTTVSSSPGNSSATAGSASVGADSATPTASATAPAAAGAVVPPFCWSIAELPDEVKDGMVESGSWKPRDPVDLSRLRLIEVTYWGFDDQAHTGRLVVNADWAYRLCGVFEKIYEARFPIRSMNLIDEYDASDRKSMNADNTSCYNGRYRGGSDTVWSMHAYGLAIDINPVENPWVYSSGYSPAAGEAYLDRSLQAPGLIHAGDVVVEAFASIGWIWGGSWTSSHDYQHFSSNGE